jgi:hypothetical protein
VTIVITGIAAIVVHREQAGREALAGERKLWGALLLLAALATVMMLRPSSILWQILPKLRFVQFPWRWMSILTVPFAYFLAAAVAKRRLGWLWSAAVLVVLAGMGTFFVSQTWWDADDIDTIQAGITQDTGFDGTDEYDPAGDDHYNLPAQAPRVQILPIVDSLPAAPEAKVSLDRWTAEERDLRVTAAAPVRLGLRLLNYPAWRVEVNGSPIVPESAADSDQMILELPAGESRVRAHFTRTGDRTLGGILSILSLLVALALFLLPIQR